MQILGKMKIRQFQNREFQGTLYFGLNVLKNYINFDLLSYLAIIYLLISIEKLAVTKKVGFITKCGYFLGFKKMRTANPRNSKPRIARIPCIFFQD